MLDMITRCMMAYAAASRLYTSDRRKVVGETRCLVQKVSGTHMRLRHMHAGHDVCRALRFSLRSVLGNWQLCCPTSLERALRFAERSLSRKWQMWFRHAQQIAQSVPFPV